MEIRLEQREPVRVVGLLHTGPLSGLPETWGEFHRRAKAAGIEGPNTAICALFRFDGDGITEYWATAHWEGPAPADDRLRILSGPGGTFAVTRYTGPYDRLGEMWGAFMAALRERGHKPADSFYREVYLDDASVTPADQLRTELLVPLA